MYPNYTTYPQIPLQLQQQRLMEMEQQYPQYVQQPVYQPQKTAMVKCRAVTSYDEAKASMIDLDGSVNVFTDIGNKKIYTKQINLDGTATLNTYILQENEPDPAKETCYVKQEELETVCQNLSQQIQDLQDELTGYKRVFSELQKPAKKGEKK